jgi:hypothetical protein
MENVAAVGNKKSKEVMSTTPSKAKKGGEADVRENFKELYDIKVLSAVTAQRRARRRDLKFEFRDRLAPNRPRSAPPGHLCRFRRAGNSEVVCSRARRLQDGRPKGHFLSR